jgi:hypothetical protein
METQLGQTHDWYDRPLEIDPAKIIHFTCRKCARSFVEEKTGKRFAIHVSAFTTYRLADEVTEQWLSEPCPNERRAADLKVHYNRFENGSSAAKSKSPFDRQAGRC